MDILIKNIEMPVDHGIFLVICPDGTIEQKVGTADNGYPIYNIVKDAKAVALHSHGDLIDRGLVQEVLAQLLPLVITNELTDKEIGLVHMTVGAIAEMINEQEVVVEATE